MVFTFFKYYSLPYWLRHKTIGLLCLLSICLGVAVLVGIHSSGQAAQRSFANTLQALVGRATHQVLADSPGLPDSLLAKLRRIPGVKIAAPSISDYVECPVLADYPLLLVGSDPFADAALQGSAASPLASKLLSNEWFYRQSLWVSPALARGNLPRQTALLYGSRRHQITLAGALPSNAWQSAANVLLCDIATAQEILGRQAWLDSIYLQLDQQREGVEQAVQAALPPGARLQPAQTALGQTQDLLRSYNLNLNALSLLSLLVGAFLIYNASLFSILARKERLGVLRCLGISRLQLIVCLAAESIAFGLGGSLIGLWGGQWLADIFVKVNSQTISNLYAYVRVNNAPLDAGSMLLGLLLGLGSTLLASLPPLWEAAAWPATLSLRHNAETAAQKQLQRWLPAGLFAAGLAWFIARVPSPSPIPGFAAALFYSLAAALLCPVWLFIFCRLAYPLAKKFAWREAGLSLGQLQANFSRLSTALAALVLALGLNLGLRLMVQSFRSTVESWAKQTLQADIYIRPSLLGRGQHPAYLDQSFIQALQAEPQTAELWQLCSREITYQNHSLRLNALSESGLAQRIQLLQGKADETWKTLHAGGVLVSEPFWHHFGKGLGQTLELPTPSGPKAFPIAGVFKDYSSQAGLIMMALPVYQRIYLDQQVTALGVVLKPNHDVSQVLHTWQTKYLPLFALDMRDNRSLRQEVRRIFDQTFAITRALEAFTLLVAGLGILATLLCLFSERRRSLALLSALGATRGQMARVVLWEGTFLACLASLAAIILGLLLAWVLIWVINLRSFGWSINPSYGWQPFLRTIALALFSTWLACMLPAIKAASPKLTRSLTEE